ncbi:MAG TPA: SurA N-terminal domain-containing protein [Terriglobales bacterium]
MKRNLILAIVLLGTSVATLCASAGTIVDRIVATVNGQIILQSDWDDAIRYHALVDDQALNAVSADERKAALDHLIDQELLKEQMSADDFQQSSDEEIAREIRDIRKRYPGCEADEKWDEVLDRYGLNEQTLKRSVGKQLNLMRLVDEHLRPTVNIDTHSIESYYNQELLPQLRQSGAGEVPLAEVTPKIKELLTQQKVNELLVAWLHNLRSSSDIRTEPGTLSAGENAQ